jgi:hypothetical protein
MTYTFKLSRRLAISKIHPMVASLLLLCACTGSEMLDPSVVEMARGGIKGPPRNRSTDTTLVQLTIDPTKAILKPTEKRLFFAKGIRKNGDTITVSARWLATGGEITSAGEYSAGSTPGTYQVIGIQNGSTLADTSQVVIASPETPNPTLSAIILMPAAITLSAGETQQFAAYGRMSSGDSVALAVTFTATGGTINGQGLYAAGPTGGAFQVIADASGLADTSSVSITVPPPAPAPPPPPPPSPTPAPAPIPGVSIAPGESWQAKVDANPTGTVFRVLAGRHVQQSVLPKTGDQFIGDPGAVMDGENVVQYAFRSSAGNPDNVTIRGIRVTRYAPPLQLAMIEGAFYGNPGELTSGWVVENCEIDNSTNVGIKLGSNWIVRNNNIHHNARLGLGSGGSNSLVEGNEIAYNWLPGVTDPVVEAGGSKFSRTTGLILRNNYAHHNRGPALWLDIDNDNFLIEGNRIEDNGGTAIEIEISYGGVIRNNVIRGSGNANWGFGSAIGIEASGGRGLEIYGNSIDMTGGNGIILMQQNRGSGNQGAWLTQNVSVHDNMVTYGGTGAPIVAGGVQDVGSTAIFSSRNNRFENNSYNLTGAKSNPFSWNNAYLSEAQWRSFGNDESGTFMR